MSDHVRELRQAAKVLRHVVGNLPDDMKTPIWRVVGTDSEYFDGVIIDGTDGDDGWLIETHHELVAAYVAAMRPAVASALAVWLESEADSLELHRDVWTESILTAVAHIEKMFAGPLGVARAILGVLEP